MQLLGQGQRLAKFGLAFWLMLSSCYSNAPNQVESGNIKLKDQSLDTAKESPDEVSIDLAVIRGGTSSRELLQLVSAIDEVDYRLLGCESGYMTFIPVLGASQTAKLYKYDRFCRISLDQIKLAGIVYRMPVGTSFDSSLNAINEMQSPDGKVIYATVQTQLPDVLSQASYSVSFVLSETLLGASKTVPIYEVGIAVAPSEIAESSNELAQFTVRRASPAMGALTVNLAVSGTATVGIDTSSIPSSIVLADGQTTASFVVSVKTDLVPEPYETVQVAIAAGGYIPRDPPAVLSIKDDDIALLNANPLTLNFGSRALNLPNQNSVLISNTGVANASAMQVASGLAAPFYFPGGYPGNGGSCQSILAAGASCTLVFGFNPISAGAFSNAVILSYFNGVETSNLSFNLQGTGASAAHLVLDPGPRYDFGAQIPATSLVTSIIVENKGTATASSLTGAFSGSQFSYLGGAFPGTGGNCSTSLAAGSSCTLKIQFIPSSLGPFSSSFTLSYYNGSQTLSTVLTLEGMGKQILALGQTYTTGLNTAKTISLQSKGAAPSASYEILQKPVFGSLSGLAPNISYTPNSGFKGVDSFIFRVIDSTGPSAAASIRILVQPKAVFLVAQPSALNTMDLRFKAELEAQGYLVKLIDDGVSSTSDAINHDLVGVSASIAPNSVLTKYRDVRLPVIIWERGLYDDMKMVSSSSATGSTSNSTNIQIVNNSNSITQGFALGSSSVLLSATKMSYVTNADSNLIKLATMDGNTSRPILWGYEANDWMPGSMIAPARRLATFFPSSNGDFTSNGLTLMKRSIEWSIQSINQLLDDSFQREPSDSLGQAWIEVESNPSEISGNGQALKFQTTDSSAFARRSFTLQNSGILSLRVYLDLQRTGTLPNDYHF
ncbi:MAG: choice-of-anchor D domain-containing protein, partial [Proteobacteria bacterium]|nr:choice-of-anchor D domain-containing protein [Pseudomonadota bacterium]